jgi:hypothetical protein
MWVLKKPPSSESGGSVHIDPKHLGPMMVRNREVMLRQRQRSKAKATPPIRRGRAAMSVVFAFAAISGLLAAVWQSSTAKTCPGGCKPPSTCNSDTGKCEGNARGSLLAGGIDMNILMYGTPDAGEDMPGR